MPERDGPKLYSIAAHRGFADALVAGLAPRYAEGDVGLARLTLLLPSRRAVRTVTEAFVRLHGRDRPEGGLLLPRMSVVGDLDLDETLGPLLDPLGAAGIPPAADPTRRWLRLAHYLHKVENSKEVPGSQNDAALLRRAFEIGRTMDHLLVEGLSPIDVFEKAEAIVGDLAGHWSRSTATFLKVQQYWIAELDARGEVDAPVRRNMLFEHAARQWQQTPPTGAIVAAGVTSASPALAKLLRVVSELPRGAVILPDLDLSLDAAVWDELGVAGSPAEAVDPPFGRQDAVTHPQYHLKLLLGRMGISRSEVQAWHRSGPGAAPPERSRVISNLFLPPEASAVWVDLPADQRRLSGVRMMEAAHPEEEAQAIAVLMREALESPERRVALITPDRGLASRVVAHLGRWGIEADDTAGIPLSQTASGRLVLLLAEVMAEQAAPVSLIALLSHPLAGVPQGRADWLDNVRRFDRRLRGPRLLPGLGPLRDLAARHGLAAWWEQVEAVLAPLFELPENNALHALLDSVVAAGEALCGEALWDLADGRMLASTIDDLRAAAADAGTMLRTEDVHAVLSDLFDRVSVRPTWGKHPRIAIYGLLEARMSRADLVICGGMVEGKWPGHAAPDPVLPPAVLRALGVPGADFRIGLSAHDLAAALGSPEVVLSWSKRDEGGPVIPSRFVLRVQALLGEQLERHVDRRPIEWARAIDAASPVPSHPRPQPMPDAEQRKVEVSVTGLDRLRGDPYQFYANAILRLRSIDALDAEPSAAWKGEIAHKMLQLWHEAGEPDGGLHDIANRVLAEANVHPLMRALWWPRLSAALDWVDAAIAQQKASGRKVIAVEASGGMEHRGIRVTGRADRIDRLADGTLGIVDYKTGDPPRNAQVKAGYALQLGLVGLIAQAGGFRDADGTTLEGTPSAFEYWSFSKAKSGKRKGEFGYVQEPVTDDPAKQDKLFLREDFVSETRDFLDDALNQWILGDEPFTARLNPDLPSYAEYDQLMRLDEWITSLGSDEGDEP